MIQRHIKSLTHDHSCTDFRTGQAGSGFRIGLRLGHIKKKCRSYLEPLMANFHWINQYLGHEIKRQAHHEFFIAFTYNIPKDWPYMMNIHVLLLLLKKPVWVSCLTKSMKMKAIKGYSIIFHWFTHAFLYSITKFRL